MKSLVIYQSRHGNTRAIASAVAEGLSERGEARVLPIERARPDDLRRAQLVVLGAAGRQVPLRMARLVRRHQAATWFGRPMAAFDTRPRAEFRRPGAASVLVWRLSGAGAMVAADPESFAVSGAGGPVEDGELDRARIWGRRLHLAERVTLDGE